MTTEIITYDAQPLTERMSYAQTVAVAVNMLPKGLRGTTIEETAANTFFVLETGAMLDMHPIAALSSVNIIEGKPALSADLMVSVVRRAGHTVRVTESGAVEDGDYKATVTVIRADDPEHPTVSTWTPHRAARAGLCAYNLDEKTGKWSVVALSRNNSPLPWQAYTESLCKARAKSEACRDGAGDTLNGARYTPEELGAEMSDDGTYNVTSLEAEPEKPSALPTPRKRATTGKQGSRRKTAAQAKAEAEAAEAAAAEAANVVDAEIVEAEVVEPAAAPAPAPVAEPAEPVAAPAAPAPAPVVDEAAAAERAERERMAAEQMQQVSKRDAIIATASDVDRADEAAVKAWNEQHGKATGHYLTSDAEIARQQAATAAPSADDAPMYVDEQGTVYDSQADLDAGQPAPPSWAPQTNHPPLASFGCPDDTAHHFGRHCGVCCHDTGGHAERSRLPDRFISLHL